MWQRDRRVGLADDELDRCAQAGLDGHRRYATPLDHPPASPCNDTHGVEAGSVTERVIARRGLPLRRWPTPPDAGAGAGKGTSVIEEAVLQRVLGSALKTGGEFAEVFAEDRRNSSALLDDGKVEELTSGRDRGAGIRVVVGDTTGFAHTADLTEAGLLAAAEAAAAAAKGGGGGTRTVALTRRAASRGYDIETYPGDVPKARKVELLTRADEIARSAGGAISQVSVSYGDSRRRILVANSDGLLAEDDTVRTFFAVSCVATGDTGMQTGRESIGHTVGFELFDMYDVDELARRAADRALTKLGRPPRAQRRRCPSSSPAAAAACCSTRPAATASRPTSSPRAPRCSATASASRSPAARHPRRRRHHGQGVGQHRHRRRGQPRPAQRAHRGRRAHRLHVGPPAGPQGGPAVVGQRPPPELPAPADGAHDQHLPARRHRRPRRHRRLHREGRAT